MYKTILVPLDGSKRAEAILPHVEELARRYKAKVFFLQVIQPPVDIYAAEASSHELYRKVCDQQEDEAKSYLADLEYEFREKGIDAQKCIARGPVIETIISIAEDKNADIITIASHGRTGLSRVFYGSISAGLLHSIDRPLLLIRSRN